MCTWNITTEASSCSCGYKYSSHLLQSVPAHPLSPPTHARTRSHAPSLSCTVKVKICTSSDGQADGQTLIQKKNPRKVPCLLSHNWRGAYEELALWLLNLATSPWTNGKPESESRFRPGTQAWATVGGRVWSCGPKIKKLHHHCTFLLQAACKHISLWQNSQRAVNYMCANAASLCDININEHHIWGMTLCVAMENTRPMVLIFKISLKSGR